MQFSSSHDKTLPRRRATDSVDAADSSKNQARDEAGSERYEELGEISRGGCGLVLRAYDRALQRDVALKKILPHIQRNAEVDARFLNEARITARLAHPGIAPVHDLGTDPATGAPYYAMKWLHGVTLAESIEQLYTSTSKPPRFRGKRDLLSRFLQVCQTVAHAHANGVVHRDLKPSNILLGEFAETIVLDWGLSKVLPQSLLLSQNDVVSAIPTSGTDQWKAVATPASDLTNEGSVLGTASYMAPEQARGDSHLVDCRSDVFSLGVILYEILTGKSPFRCRTSHESIEHVLRTEYAPLLQVAPGTPKSIVAICNKALSADPDARYPSAHELARDIASFLNGDAVVAYAEPLWAKVDRVASNHRTLTWASFLSLSAIALISLISNIHVRNAHENEHESRLLAEKEHQDKTIALQNEQQAHRAAVTQLQAARESVDGWVLELDADLAFYPGLKELRMHLMDRAVHHYETLASQPVATSLESLEVARAKIHLAEIHRVNRRYEPASKWYAAGVAQLDALGSPPGTDWYNIERVQRAKALNGMGSIAIESRVDIETASQLLHEAIKYVEVLGENTSIFVEAQRSLARSLQLEALCSSISGNAIQADEKLTQAIATLELLNNHPISSKATRQRLCLLEDLAKFRFERGDYPQAHEAYQRIIHLYDSMLAQGRTRPDWLEARANAQVYSAACNSELVQPNEAVLAFEAAEEDIRNAWSIFGGEAMYHEKVSNVYDGLGHSFLLVGDVEQAERILTLSIESMQRASKLLLPTAGFLKRITQNRLWLAMAKEKLQKSDLQDVLEKVGGCLSRLTEMQEKDAEVDFLRMQLAWLESQQLWTMSQHDSAEKIIRQELSREKAATGNLLAKGYLDLYQGRLLATLSRIQKERGDFDAANETMQQAQQYWLSSHQTLGRPAASAAFELLRTWAEQPHWTDEQRIRCLTLATSMTEHHETSPTAWFWMAEISHKDGDRETAEIACKKLERLRPRSTVEDKLLLGLIRGGGATGRESIGSSSAGHESTETFVSTLSPLAVPRGSHAHYLREQVLLQQR